MTDPSSPLPELPEPGSLSDPLLVLLTRIEHHLARIAQATESFTSAPISFQKELGPIRTMPEPLKR